MRFTKRQRENLGKIVSDIGKLFFAVVVLGPWVSPSGFNSKKLILGIAASLICFIFGIFVDRGGD